MKEATVYENPKNSNEIAIKTKEGLIVFLSKNSKEIRNIELSIKSVDPVVFKLFSYIENNLSNIKIYQDNSLHNLLYDINYYYTGDNLSSVQVTRIIDNFSYIKEFSYDINNNLLSINAH